MKSMNNQQLFTEITAEESAAINGGFLRNLSQKIEEAKKSLITYINYLKYNPNSKYRFFR